MTIVVMFTFNIGFLIFHKSFYPTLLSNQSSLFLENIEVLAQNENDYGICYQLGALDCSGIKVKYIIPSTK